MTIQNYGSNGRLGLLVPPANTTIEPELAAALPIGMSLHSTRLPGRNEPDTSIGLKERFLGYNESLAQVADSFGGAELDALCYGVTGSCYLVGNKGEENLLKDLKAGGTQHVTTAARALGELLRAIGARRIALVVPYPDWLTELAVAYWRELDFDVVQVEPMSGVVSIYGAKTDQVVATAKIIESTKADAIVLSGTGLITLPAIETLSKCMDIPVISSNLSLAWWGINTLSEGQSTKIIHPALLSLQQWLPASIDANEDA